MVGTHLLPLCITACWASHLQHVLMTQAFAFTDPSGWYCFPYLLTYQNLLLMLQIHTVVTNQLVLREGGSEQRLKTRPGPWTDNSLLGKVALDLPSLWNLPCFDQCGRMCTIKHLCFETILRLRELWCDTSLERQGHYEDQLETKAAASMGLGGPSHLGWILPTVTRPALHGWGVKEALYVTAVGPLTKWKHCGCSMPC